MHLIAIVTTSTTMTMVAMTSPAVRGAPSDVISCIGSVRDEMLIGIFVIMSSGCCDVKSMRNCLL